MEDLLTRLRAAIDETEAAALAATERVWRPDGAVNCEVYVLREDGSNRTIARCWNGYDDDWANSLHIVRHDPASVLRMVAAHRKILDLHTVSETFESEGITSTITYCPVCQNDGECPTLEALAEGYGIEV